MEGYTGMKKIAFLLALLLTVAAFAACAPDYMSWTKADWAKASDEEKSNCAGEYTLYIMRQSDNAKNATDDELRAMGKSGTGIVTVVDSMFGKAGDKDTLKSLADAAFAKNPDAQVTAEAATAAASK